MSDQQTWGFDDAFNYFEGVAGPPKHTSFDAQWSNLDAMIWPQDSLEFSIPPVDYHLFEMCLRGEVRQYTDFAALVGPRDFVYRPEMTTFVPAGQAMQGWLEEGDSVFFHLVIDKAVMNAAIDDVCGGDPDRIELSGFQGKYDKHLTNMARIIQHELMHPSAGGAVLADSIAQAVCVQLLRHNPSVADRPVSSPYRIGKPGMQRAVDFVEANLGKNIGLKDIAGQAGMSPYHFSRSFKKSTGKTPHVFLSERRMALARELLLQTNLQLPDIATACGLRDQSQLTVVFKRMTGTTPARYRREMLATQLR